MPRSVAQRCSRRGSPESGGFGHHVAVGDGNAQIELRAAALGVDDGHLATVGDATWLTIASPSPDPGRERASGPRQKRAKTCSSSDRGNPGPWSRTLTTPSATVTSTCRRRA